MRQEMKIDRLGFRGDGIAHGPIYAPLTLPDEVVSGVIEGDALRDLRIVTPSPNRVAAPCRHFKSCGGCQLQHASDDFVADWKTSIVRDALTAHGIDTDLRPILTSPAQSRRRVALSARRTKKGAMVGFHARGSDAIIEITECHLLDPELKPALDVARELAITGGSRKGELTVQVNLSDNGLDVAVTGGKLLDTTLEVDLANVANRFHLARLAWDYEVVALCKPPYQQFGAARVVPPPAAFLQATQQGEADLVKTVRDIIGPVKKLADLFSGCGTFSLPLAEGAEVHAVEGDAFMLAALDRGWREAAGLKRVTHEARDLFERPLMPDELKKFDALVIDPPRAGALAQVQEIVQSNVPVLAYVSCNPQTFARDAKVLIDAGFTADFVQPVDQFRWSPHIELVGSFKRT